MILSGLLPFCGSLQADDDAFIDNQNISSEKMMSAESESEGIFHLSAKADWVQQAGIDKRGFHHNHVKFNEAGVQGTAIVYYNEHCKEGLALGVGFDHVYFSWNKNFYFHRKDFNDVSFTLSAFSERLSDWLWQAQLSVNCDAKYWSISEYTNYDFFLWGRYEYCCNVNLHAGFFAQTGMKIDHIYPIIGFDWTINDRWKLNCVFPFNMSLVYTYNENWSAALAGRIFDVRYRVGKHEPLSKGLFEYRNKGVELAIHYDTKMISANIHGGSTFGGQFKISNHNNKHKKHFNLDAAPYVGGEISMKF